MTALDVPFGGLKVVTFDLVKVKVASANLVWAISQKLLKIWLSNFAHTYEMAYRCAFWRFKGYVTFDLVKVKAILQILSGLYLRNY